MGLTRIRAQQISDIDYKQAVRVVTTTDITLSGGAPASVDGVNLQVNDRILVTAQDPGSENGIYRVQILGQGENGTWIRTTDANDTGEMQPGMVVMVTEGDTYADTPWKLTTNGTIVIGETELTFQRFSANVFPGGSNTSIQFNSGNVFAGTNDLTWDGSELRVVGTANVVGNISVVSVASNLVPVANVTYDLGNVNNRWNDLWLAGNTIYVGDQRLSVDEEGNWIFTIAGGNIALGANVPFSPDVIESTGNITGANISAQGDIQATGNVSGTFIKGDGSELGNVIADRGNDTNNWNTLTTMGVYKVNRESWSGVTGAPTDSPVFFGILQVMSSSDATVQIFYPGSAGAVESDVKIQWNRSLWNGSWTNWYKIVNNQQIIDAGSY